MGSQLIAVVELDAFTDLDGDPQARLVVHDLPAFRQPVDALEVRRDGEQVLVEEIHVVAVHAGRGTRRIDLLGFRAEGDDDLVRSVRAVRREGGKGRRHERPHTETRQGVTSTPCQNATRPSIWAAAGFGSG